MPSELSYALATINLLGALGFGYIAYRFYILSTRAGSRLDPPVAFTLLLASQLAGAIAQLAPERLSFASYVATGTFTAGALASLLAQRSRGYAAITVPYIPPALLAAASDAIAALVSALGAMKFRGEARLLSAVLALAFTLRLASIPLLPSPLGVALLTGGEGLRALGAAALAIRYAIPAASVRSHGEEEK